MLSSSSWGLKPRAGRGYQNFPSKGSLSSPTRSKVTFATPVVSRVFREDAPTDKDTDVACAMDLVDIFAENRLVDEVLPSSGWTAMLRIAKYLDNANRGTWHVQLSAQLKKLAGIRRDMLALVDLLTFNDAATIETQGDLERAIAADISDAHLVERISALEATFFAEQDNMVRLFVQFLMGQPASMWLNDAPELGMDASILPGSSQDPVNRSLADIPLVNVDDVAAAVQLMWKQMRSDIADGSQQQRVASGMGRPKPGDNKDVKDVKDGKGDAKELEPGEIDMEAEEKRVRKLESDLAEQKQQNASLATKIADIQQQLRSSGSSVTSTADTARLTELRILQDTLAASSAQQKELLDQLNKARRGTLCNFFADIKNFIVDHTFLAGGLLTAGVIGYFGIRAVVDLIFSIPSALFQYKAAERALPDVKDIENVKDEERDAAMTWLKKYFGATVAADVEKNAKKHQTLLKATTNWITDQYNQVPVQVTAAQLAALNQKLKTAKTMATFTHAFAKFDVQMNLLESFSKWYVWNLQLPREDIEALRRTFRDTLKNGDVSQFDKSALETMADNVEAAGKTLDSIKADVEDRVKKQGFTAFEKVALLAINPSEQLIIDAAADQTKLFVSKKIEQDKLDARLEEHNKLTSDLRDTRDKLRQTQEDYSIATSERAEKAAALAEKIAQLEKALSALQIVTQEAYQLRQLFSCASSIDRWIGNLSKDVIFRQVASQSSIPRPFQEANLQQCTVNVKFWKGEGASAKLIWADRLLPDQSLNLEDLQLSTGFPKSTGTSRALVPHQQSMALERKTKANFLTVDKLDFSQAGDMLSVREDVYEIIGRRTPETEEMFDRYRTGELTEEMKQQVRKTLGEPPGNDPGLASLQGATRAAIGIGQQLGNATTAASILMSPSLQQNRWTGTLLPALVLTTLDLGEWINRTLYARVAVEMVDLVLEMPEVSITPADAAIFEYLKVVFAAKLNPQASRKSIPAHEQGRIRRALNWCVSGISGSRAWGLGSRLVSGSMRGVSTVLANSRRYVVGAAATLGTVYYGPLAMQAAEGFANLTVYGAYYLVLSLLTSIVMSALRRERSSIAEYAKTVIVGRIAHSAMVAMTPSLVEAASKMSGDESVQLFMASATTVAVSSLAYMLGPQKQKLEAAQAARQKGNVAAADKLDEDIASAARDRLVKDVKDVKDSAIGLVARENKETKRGAPPTSTAQPKTTWGSRVVESAAQLVGLSSPLATAELAPSFAVTTTERYTQMRADQDARDELLRAVRGFLADQKFSKRQDVVNILALDGKSNVTIESKEVKLGDSTDCLLDEVQFAQLISQADIAFRFAMAVAGSDVRARMGQAHQGNLRAMHTVLQAINFATKTLPIIGQLSTASCNVAGNVTQLTGQWGLQDVFRLCSALSVPHPDADSVPHVLFPADNDDEPPTTMTVGALSTERSLAKPRPLLHLFNEGKFAVTEAAKTVKFSSHLNIAAMPLLSSKTWRLVGNEFMGRGETKGRVLMVRICDVFTDRWLLPMAGVIQERRSQYSGSNSDVLQATFADLMCVMYSDSRPLPRTLASRSIVTDGKLELRVYSPFFNDQAPRSEAEVAFNLRLDWKQRDFSTYIMFCVPRRCFVFRFSEDQRQGLQERIQGHLQKMVDANFGDSRWLNSPSVMSQDIIGFLGGTLKTENSVVGLPVSLFILWQT